jgi:hypothetical protein
MKKRVSPNKFKIEFDVGVNVGQSIRRISHAFPYAVIYCFEPVLSTFNHLSENQIEWLELNVISLHQDLEKNTFNCLAKFYLEN